MKNNRFLLVNIAYIGALIALQVVLGNLVQIAMLNKQMNFGFLPSPWLDICSARSADCWSPFSAT